MVKPRYRSRYAVASLVIIAIAGIVPAGSQPASLFQKLIGRWRDLSTHASLIITDTGDVFSKSQKGLRGSVVDKRSSGGNFTFEGDNLKCVYDIAFLNDGTTDWGLIDATGPCLPGGRFIKEIASNAISDEPSTSRREVSERFRITFISQGFWIHNTDLGDVHAPRSSISFLIDGEKAASMKLSERFKAFSVTLSPGTHTFTYDANISAVSGLHVDDTCSVSIDVRRDAVLHPSINLIPFDSERGKIDNCSLF